MKAAGPRQTGAALLTALLSVALIASLAGTALWQQWRVTEVEANERARLQAQWVLQGALDWGRLILAEDGRQGGADHLGEPWALPLKEARLASFLANDRNTPADVHLNDTFLAGHIEDLQSRLNVRNLIQDRAVSPEDLQAFERLFEMLQLNPQELQRLALGLRQAAQPVAGVPGQDALPRLWPQRVDHLLWLGLSPSTLDALRPHIAWLPERVSVNLNTASAAVISASTPGMTLAQARPSVEQRRRQPWKTLDEAQPSGGRRPVFQEGRHGVASSYFLISGQLRQGAHRLQAQALVHRTGLQTHVLWRDFQALAPGQLAAVLR